MPLDPSLLKTEIKAELVLLHTAEYPLSADAAAGQYEIIADAVARKVIEHFQANATVLPTALVWPGGMAPALVTGTGSVT